MMLPRILETEVMSEGREALAYDAMDHAEVNRRFVEDFLAQASAVDDVLDLGAGSGWIPIELCRRAATARVTAVDLSPAMLHLARSNVEVANLTDRIRLDLVDAKATPYEAGQFPTVISNSIVHHIPEPRAVLREAVRVLAVGGLIFFRDLMRPADEATVRQLVTAHAGEASDEQRQMLDDSLRAALTLGEMRALVTELGAGVETVSATSDRHWTWSWRKP